MIKNDKKKKQQTHSERMAALRDKAEDIQGGLETLITCKEAGNLKQVAYWVGQVSRQVSALCKECLSEELVKSIRDKKRIIT